MIFLVDDDIIQNSITSQLVQLCDPSLHYEVYNNGEEVIQALAEGKKPTKILLDINMPIMNGWEFLDAYQTYDDKARVYMLTSSDNEADMARMKDFTCVQDYYTKPINKEKMEKILSE